MSSRDGLRFDRRFLEAFVRPGPDPGNWHERAIEVGPGLVPTGDGEMSLYMIEHYRSPAVHIRRLALREEQEARQRFGAEYERYAARTPRFVPRLGASAAAGES